MTGTRGNKSYGRKSAWRIWLIALAVLVLADAACIYWALDLAKSHADPVYAAPRSAGRGDGRATPSAIYCWRGALMRPDTHRTREGYLEADGMVIVKVSVGSPAARAGLRAGDVMIGLNSFRIATPRSLAMAIADRERGPIVDVRVRRSGPAATAAILLHVPSASGGAWSPDA